MRFPFCFATFLFLILFFGTSNGGLCNLDKCTDMLTSTELRAGVDLAEKNFTGVKVAVLTGELVSGCRVDMRGVLDTYHLDLSMSWGEETVNIVLKYKAYKLEAWQIVLDQILSTDTGQTSAEMVVEFLLSESNKFANIYQGLSKITAANYDFDENYLYQKGYVDNLLKGMKVLDQSAISRTVTSYACSEDFTLHLCPCLEPSITELALKEDGNLTCKVASRQGADDVRIKWELNGHPIASNQTTEEQLTPVLMSSVIRNVTQTNNTLNYTCVASLKEDRAISPVTKTKIIPAYGSDENGEELVEDGSQALLTIVISVLVALIVLVSLGCFAVLKLVKRCAEEKNNRLEMEAMEPQLNRSVVERKEDVIEGQYYEVDLETPGESDPAPVYAQVNLAADRFQTESIYNKLEPRLMTVNRGDPDRFGTYRPKEPGTLRTMRGGEQAGTSSRMMLLQDGAGEGIYSESLRL